MAYVRKNALCFGLTLTILHLCTACAIRNISPVQTYPPPGDQDEAAFNFWLTDSPAKSVAEFQGFLADEGVDDVIPIHQLLRTASDWEECEGPAFQVPKREHWQLVVSLLRLVRELQSRKILTEFEVVSAFRNKSLNACANGTAASAHLTYAIDITRDAATVDEDERLCAFWKSEGKNWRMGLSRYESGRIHIDTTRFRTWGDSGRKDSSYCN